MPAPTVATWDPELVTTSINNLLVGGYEPGTYITHSRSTDTFDAKINVSGGAIVRKSHDRSGSISIIMSRDSPSNTILNALFTAAEASEELGVWDFMVKDLNGSGLFSGRVIIMRPPDWDADAEGPPFTWTLKILSGDVQVAGLPLV